MRWIGHAPWCQCGPASGRPFRWQPLPAQEHERCEPPTATEVQQFLATELQPRLQRFASVHVGAVCRVGEIEHFPADVYNTVISEKSLEFLTSRLRLAETEAPPRLGRLGPSAWK